jgi:hypothetical protein
MENLFLFLATSLVLRVTSPRFRRYVICPGCSTLLNSESRTLHIRYTKDGDKLFFNEYVADGITYGVICVQMQSRQTLKKAEHILVNYMNRIRKPMHIQANASMEVETNERLLTITDYWQDKAGIDWKVKGYTNGKILSLLYVKNITDTTVKTHDTFLNGFRFSAV